MAENYEHLMGSPINPDEMFYKDGSQAGSGSSDQELAQSAKMMNANPQEMRYLAAAQAARGKKKKYG